MATVAGLYGFGDDSRSHGVRFMERQRTVQRDDTYAILPTLVVRPRHDRGVVSKELESFGKLF